MKALQSNPKDPEGYYNVGLVFMRSGDCKEAVEAFSMYVNIPGLKPELQADGYNNRGICQRRLRKSDQAIADHTKAIELNPKAAAFYLSRANDYSDMGKSDDALADFGKAIASDPKFALAYAGRGRHYFTINKLDAALVDLTKAIELDPKNPEPLYTRAMVYRSKNDFDKAIPDLDRYITINPGDDRYLADAYVNRAIGKASLNKLDAAVNDASKAIELAPNYYDAYMVRAYIYRQLKKEDLAKADEDAAAKIKSGSK